MTKEDYSKVKFGVQILFFSVLFTLQVFIVLIIIRRIITIAAIVMSVFAGNAIENRADYMRPRAI